MAPLKKSSRLSSDHVSKMSSGFFLDEKANMPDLKKKKSIKSFNDEAETRKLNVMYKQKVKIGETFTNNFQAKIDNGLMRGKIRRKVDEELAQEFQKKGFTSEGNRVFKISEKKADAPPADSDETISSCRLSEESEERAALAEF